MKWFNPKHAKIKASSPVFETCWKIRTRIDPLLSGSVCPVITVTSAGKAEGKTTTAVNLACTYAQQGKQVLLIDGNLRNPELHKLFGVSNRSGLTNVSLDRYEKSDVVRCSKVGGLALVTSGPGIVDPIELLTSTKMSAFIDELRNEYDLIIIDSPPALGSSDAQILSAMSDGVLIVIKEGKVKRDTAVKLKSALEQINATIVGTVFNQKSRRKSSAS